MTHTQAPAVAVGTPATQVYVTDSRALVVSRVSASGRTIWTQSVELDESTRRRETELLAEGEPPVMLVNGDLTKPYGPERQWRWTRGAWRNGGDRVYLGHSIQRVDYKM
jgi:hypothetical protein